MPRGDDDRLPAAKYRDLMALGLPPDPRPAHQTRQATEADIQRACVELAGLILRDDATMFAVRNEQADELTRKIASGMGLLPGVGDLGIMVPIKIEYDIHEPPYFEEGSFSAIYWIEVKTPERRNNLSPAQLEFKERCRSAHAPYRVVCSVDEFQKCLTDWNLTK